MTGNLDGLRVNHAALNAAAQDMYDTVKKMDERLDRLERELEPLRSQWSGNQQESYRIAKTAWDVSMKEMRDLLDESSRTVYQSNDEYMAADRRGANRFA